MKVKKPYIRYGKEWEKEMSKLPKIVLIKMIRKIITGVENAEELK